MGLLSKKQRGERERERAPTHVRVESTLWYQAEELCLMASAVASPSVVCSEKRGFTLLRFSSAGRGSRAAAGTQEKQGSNHPP